MKRWILMLNILLPYVLVAEACTTAVVSGKVSRDGHPMLWKNRDTSHTDNKVEYIAGQDGEYGFVALFNSEDRDCEEAWIGMNEVGFAIMNAASYNLKADNVPVSQMDKEGILMALALKSCRTVDDFQRFLTQYPRPMGVESNFGVLDADGNCAYFETDNYNFVKYDVNDSPVGVLVRTNYSHSGREGEGYGQIREANALYLLSPYINESSIAPETFTEELSRSFYHSLLRQDLSETDERWIVDQDFIPRYSSTASVVVEGIAPGESVDKYIMWTAVGYPPCAEVIPVWCKEDGVDKCLRGNSENGHSLQCDIVKARQSEIFCAPDGNRNRYIDLHRLYNPNGTGYNQHLRSQNLNTYNRIRALRDEN